jgi:thioredoxin 1
MSFEDEIKEGKVVADFYAEWCGPCKQLAPIFEKLKEEYKDIKFIKVDIEEQKEIAAQFSVMSIPCLIFFKDGSEVDRIVGFSGEQDIKEKLDSL